jgi:ABC-2 type transport system permease protein
VNSTTNPPQPPFVKGRGLVQFGGLGGGIYRRPVFVLARKELFTLLNSPATYVVCVVFLVTSGWLFAAPLFQFNQSSLDTFLRPLPLLFTFLLPALTMRSFSEEFKAGTIEYLATLPIKDYEIVLGKYLGVLGWLSIVMVFTLAYPLLILLIGRPDIGHLIGSYVAIAGLGAFFAAIGLWASALTRNQVIAFIVSFFVCFTLYLLERVADFMPGVLSEVVRSLGVTTHFEGLSRGVLDSRDLLYWASGSLFFLGACLAVMNSRRWR